MTLDEKIEKLIENDDHVAYQLLFEDRGDWREIPDEFVQVRKDFGDAFEKAVIRISKRYGPPTYIEREWSPDSPPWAPMGLYADWRTNDQGDINCVFLGGDGNPEDPLFLLAGRTTKEAKTDGMDPWQWKWID